MTDNANDAAVLVIDSGNYFTADYDAGSPVGLPADLSAPGVDWESVGHTDLEDIFNLTSEGGEATTIGTLQNKTLRTKYASRTDSLNFNLQQFDEAGLKLYFGSNSTIGSDGEVQVANNPTPTTCSFLAIFVDGDNHFAIYAPKAEVFRSDDVAPGDGTAPASLPLAVKFLQHGANAWNYAITPLGGGS